VDEAGLPGLYESQWYGWFAPKDTPGNVIVRLNAAVMNALAAPAVRQRLADIACEIPPPEEQTPKPSARCRKPDIEKWWPIVKQANIKAR
jgi:tripartite-type tricarboxylate transporter receptor subunit TctC